MTEQRDDFEHRLGQGLKRWAEAGEPTFDLETLVTTKPAPRRARWMRWAISAAAALLLVTGATFTFP
ncbi:MAG TPA: hypothetical protein VNT75_27995, partial [Symbiobacteriaceae bacterium]|nr:hypothetical protein [Symbiobacteriaceae bacterium]